MNTLFNKVFYLKKLCALLLLFVFVLGITPKKTLHTWFANHKDSTSSARAGNRQELTKAGFNCNCDDLVAESHFVIFNNNIIIHIAAIFSFADVPSLPWFSSLLIAKNLRGPPFKV